MFLARPGVVSYGAAVLGLVGIVLTNHRSGYLALVVVAIALFFHFRRTSSRTMVVLLVVIASAVSVLVVSPTIRQNVHYSLGTMLNPTADSNAADRVERSKLGWDYFVANPLGDYTWSHRNYLVNAGPADFEPHNFVVQILAQQGIVGFALIAAISLSIMRIAWRNRESDRVSAVMLACFTFYLFFCLFNTNILDPWNIMLLVVPAGLILDPNATLVNARPPLPRSAVLATQDS